MKKVFCFILACLLVFSMAACGNQEEPAQKDDPKTETTDSGKKDPEQTKPTDDEPDATDPVKPEQYMTFYWEPDVSFSYPQDMNMESAGSGYAVYDTDDCAVGVLSVAAEGYDGAVENIVTEFTTIYPFTMTSYGKGYIGFSQIEVLESEVTTLAGYEAAKFTGKVNNGDWDSHIYGYTFCINDYYFIVAGVVFAKEQAADMIAEINALTDQIAVSVQVEK